MEEIHANAIKQPETLGLRTRQYLRKIALDLAAVKSSQSECKKNFVRCLYMHYVFDDQREQFETHIKNLKNIAQFITTDELLQLIENKDPIDGKYFHLSFDDGLDCVRRNASPILKKYHIPAIIFVNSAAIEDETKEIYERWLFATNYKMPLKLMSWNSLADSGLEVGAHTRTHARLTEISLSQASLLSEISGCKKDIEKKLGLPCKYFAWPFGKLTDIDKESIRVIRESGYKASFGVYRSPITTSITNKFLIPRHHFEPEWPQTHVRYFALGGFEKMRFEGYFVDKTD